MSPRSGGRDWSWCTCPASCLPGSPSRVSFLHSPCVAEAGGRCPVSSWGPRALPAFLWMEVWRRQCSRTPHPQAHRSPHLRHPASPEEGPEVRCEALSHWGRSWNQGSGTSRPRRHLFQTVSELLQLHVPVCGSLRAWGSPVVFLPEGQPQVLWSGRLPGRRAEWPPGLILFRPRLRRL